MRAEFAGAVEAVVTGAERSRARKKARRCILRELGMSWREAKKHSGAALFCVALRELGRELRDYPIDLTTVRAGGRPRRETIVNIRRRAYYAQLRALGANSREATVVAKCGRIATVRYINELRARARAV